MLDPLSATELRVIPLIAEGLSNREVGLRLDISEQTVATHLSHILQKLGLRNRVQVAVWAVKQGLT